MSKEQVKHTPGPWRVWNGHTDVFAAVGQNTPSMIEGFRVAVCDLDSDDIRTEKQAEKVALANARLISAAPDLLEALQACMEWIKELAESGDAGFFEAKDVEAWVRGKAAIASATGEPSGE